jgi:hypothetical protein
MNNPFMNDLCRKINSLHPGAGDQLDRIDELPDSTSKMLVNILLEAACQSQNVGNITSARKMMLRIPPVWLASALHDAIEAVVDLNDEWEYRRLIELLKELKSEVLTYYLDYGMAVGSSAIYEATIDMKNH